MENCPSSTAVSLDQRFLEDLFPGKEGGWYLGTDSWMGFLLPGVPWVSWLLGNVSGLVWRIGESRPLRGGISFHPANLYVYLRLLVLPWSCLDSSLWRLHGAGGTL